MLAFISIRASKYYRVTISKEVCKLLMSLSRNDEVKWLLRIADKLLLKKGEKHA